jgi:hypothetical protein
MRRVLEVISSDSSLSQASDRMIPEMAPVDGWAHSSGA